MLAEAGTLDETGNRDVLESDKRKPDMATILGSVDPQIGEDFVAGNILGNFVI